MTPRPCLYPPLICLLQVGEDQAKCLSGCEDQINSVSVTSSSFPNRETLVRREEFCLTVLKLVKTCNSAKRVLLTVQCYLSYPSPRLGKKFVSFMRLLSCSDMIGGDSKGERGMT